jgi:glyoxylase-like metal-dependent hydrolase (beta-lactamase superfamily II)
MSLDRRRFLASSSLALAASAFNIRELLAQAAAAGQAAPAGQAPAAAAQAPPQTAFLAVRDSVGYFTGRGGTIGYHISKDGIVVVDSQMAPTAQICLDGIKERAGGRTIDFLVNTHHHGDHTGGNATFKPAVAKILAHENVPELQKEAAARLAAARPDVVQPEQVVATATFGKTWREKVGSDTMALKYYGPAHTKGDAVVTFEKANVVHMGDLVFNRRHPVIDRPGGASIKNWIKVLENTVKDHRDDTIYIFGHAGPKFPVTGSKADLLFQRDYLSALLEFVRAQMKDFKLRDDVVAITEPLKGFQDHGPLNKSVLAAAYDELVS